MGAPGSGLLPLLPHNSSKEKQRRHTRLWDYFFVLPQLGQEEPYKLRFPDQKNPFLAQFALRGELVQAVLLGVTYFLVQLLIAPQILLLFLENKEH